MFTFSPIFWLVAIVVFLVIEALTYNLTTIWFAIGCIPLYFISYLGLAPHYQILVFAVLVAILLWFTKPLVLKKLKKGNNPNSLVGQKVTVVKKIDSSQAGQVKSNNGVLWRAISANNSTIDENTIVTISEVKGNTLTVSV